MFNLPIIRDESLKISKKPCEREDDIADVIWDEETRPLRLMVDTQEVMLSKLLHPYPLIS